MERVLRIFVALFLSFAAIAEALPRHPVVVIRSVSVIGENLRTNGIVESNETITCSIELQNAGSLPGLNITAVLLATNGITPITEEQHYGDMLTNGTPVTRDFAFTVVAPEGRAVQAQLAVMSGGSEIARNVFDVPVGDTAVTFTRLRTMDVPADKLEREGPSSEYPSTITISNLLGTITSIRVTLHNYSHEFAEDVNVLLVGPMGTNVMLMSDCGGFYTVSNVNLTFDSTLTNALTTQGEISSGTYSSTDYNFPNRMDAPAPEPPVGPGYLGQFRRLNPNGDWQLYVDDILEEDIGVLYGGWTLSLTILKPPVLSIVDNRDGRVQITLRNTGNRGFLIDYSSNLTNWQVLGQLPPTESATFLDGPIGQGQRFYRARRANP